MKLVFLAVNASYSHTNLAAWYLQACCADMDVEWTTVDLIASEDCHPALRRIAEIGPDVLAATFYLFNRNAALSVLRRYRALDAKCLILCGGPEFLGANREFLASERCVDAVVRGEGETAFRRMLETFRNRETFREIPGVCGTTGGEYFDNGFAEEVQDLDDLPSPYVARLTGSLARRFVTYPPGFGGDGAPPSNCAGQPDVPLMEGGAPSPPLATQRSRSELSSFRKPFVQIETSRGCRNRCAFCVSGGSGPVRYFSPERVRSDLERIRSAGIRGVRVVDRTFNDNRRRAAALLRMFRDDFPEMNFHLEVDPCMAGPAFLDELAKAGPGRFHLDVGVQTFGAETASLSGRRGSPAGTERGVRALCGLKNIAVHADLIAGLPGGAIDEVYADLRRLTSLRPAEIQLEILKLLPGTALSEERERFGITASPETPYEVLRTERMSADDVDEARRLCRLVDWFYEPELLRATIWTANDLLPAFWKDLCGFMADRESACAPSLVNRFRLLWEFFGRISERGESSGGESPGERLMQSLRYAWLKEGFSPRSDIGGARAWKGPLPAGAELVEGAPEPRYSRMAAAELDGTYVFAYGTGEDRRAVAVFRLP